MSLITDIILVTAISDKGVEPVNEWLKAKYDSRLIEVSERVGGDKMMCCDLWAGAYNHFSTKEFVDVVNWAPWEHPECFQLFVREDGDEVFQLLAQRLSCRRKR